MRALPPLLTSLAVVCVGCAWLERPTASDVDTEPAAPPVSQEDAAALIAAAPDGGEVHLARAAYVSNGPLQIVGRNDLTIAFAPGSQLLCSDVDAHVLIVRDCRDLTITGLHARHVRPLAEYNCHGSVVRIEQSRAVTLRGCELDGCGAIGVAAHDTRGLVIQRCRIHHNTFNALYLDGCSDVSVIGCIIEDNANLMQAYGVEGLEMSDNLIRRNGGYWREPVEPGLPAAP